MSHSIQEIKDTVRNFIINELLFGQGEVADNASFLEKGIIDSTGVLELVGFVESNYSVKIENEDLVPENLDSLNNIAAFLERKLKK